MRWILIHAEECLITPIKRFIRKHLDPNVVLDIAKQKLIWFCLVLAYHAMVFWHTLMFRNAFQKHINLALCH